TRVARQRPSMPGDPSWRTPRRETTVASVGSLCVERGCVRDADDRPEARLRRLGQRPDAEVLAGPDPLAVEVVVPRARLERQAERVDEQLPTPRRIGGDDSNPGNEENVHSVTPPCRRL